MMFKKLCDWASGALTAAGAKLSDGIRYYVSSGMCAIFLG